MTCNPNWPEIKENLIEGHDASYRSDLQVRVFQAKLDYLLRLIKKDKILGVAVGAIHVVEFQKRGLPHAHILVILAPGDKIQTPADVDRFVSAEIPNPITQPKLYAAVATHMFHGPCGDLNPNCVCMKTKAHANAPACSKNYPKDFCDETVYEDESYPQYRRRDTGRLVEKTVPAFGHREAYIVSLDNRWVVPYNPWLLCLFNCHMNVEVCSSIKAVKYLFKYIFKGADRAMTGLASDNDEIHMYIDSVYMSVPEAAWRIYFDPASLFGMTPNVIQLPVHLEGQHHVMFRDNDELVSVADQQKGDISAASKLDAWFHFNRDNSTLQHLLYHDFAAAAVWHDKKKEWAPRQRVQKFPAVARLYNVLPREGERFYLHVLLTNVPGATSYESLRTVNGEVCATFQEACIRLGLCADDTLWHTTLEENALTATPYQLRHLWCTIVGHCEPSNPLQLWLDFAKELSEDMVLASNPHNSEHIAALPEADRALMKQYMALCEIKHKLREYHKRELFELNGFSTLWDNMVAELGGWPATQSVSADSAGF